MWTLFHVLLADSLNKPALDASLDAEKASDRITGLIWVILSKRLVSAQGSLVGLRPFILPLIHKSRRMV